VKNKYKELKDDMTNWKLDDCLSVIISATDVNGNFVFKSPLVNFPEDTSSQYNFVAFAFMAGLVLVFLMWAAHNLPSFTDLKWLAMGGGVLIKGVHPPAKKFNAGQKLIFWSVILGGLSLSLSGWALMFPFETYFFTGTFETLNAMGIDAAAFLGLPPPPYEAIMEQQLNQIWHVIMAVVMTCIILAHIYIGSVGMEGAFDAMGSGQVDKNWAQEHHSIWAEEVEAKARAKGLAEPAE